MVSLRAAAGKANDLYEDRHSAVDHQDAGVMQESL
jgi:hypothetical protein